MSQSLIKLVVELGNLGVDTSIHYDIHTKSIYLDLQTEAKSSLHLFDDGQLHGRYGLVKKIDLRLATQKLISVLGVEVKRAMHGRDYVQEGWRFATA